MIFKILLFIWLFVVVFGIILQFSTMDAHRKKVIHQQSLLFENLNSRIKLLRDINSDMTTLDNTNTLKLLLKLVDRLNTAVQANHLNKAIDINNQLEKQVHQLVANDMDGFMQDAPLAKLIKTVVSLQTKLITLRNNYNQMVITYNKILDNPSNILVKTVRKLQPFEQLPKVDQVDTQDIQQITTSMQAGYQVPKKIINKQTTTKTSNN